jgi:hypothetical protein
MKLPFPRFKRQTYHGPNNRCETKLNRELRKAIDIARKMARLREELPK